MAVPVDGTGIRGGIRVTYSDALQLVLAYHIALDQLQRRPLIHGYAEK